MNYKIRIFIFSLLFLTGCETTIDSKKDKILITQEKKYNNSGFALIYDDKLEKIKKLEPRSLQIYHKFLKRRSMVKILNPDNGLSILSIPSGVYSILMYLICLPFVFWYIKK